MKKTFKDDLGREIDIAYPPRRIVSLVPSQTELLHDLGLEEEVVGITKFCIHPARWFREKTRVGGTKNPDVVKIRILKPDLIICNKEENEINSLNELAGEFPVWISDIKNLNDACRMITQVGEMTNRSAAAQRILTEINEVFKNLPSQQRQKKCVYLIWNDPIMTVNADTFINDMLSQCGLINIFRELSDSRYPVITPAQLKASNPELLLLPSEPFPFKQEHKNYFQNILPDCEIKLIDGEMMSWYGSRLQKFDPKKIHG
jgi:ABC-type Fe3+-hydroxamate transport system substrate-binding protein